MLKKNFLLLLVFSLTLLALGYALWDIDFEVLSALLAAGDYRALAPILVLIVLFFWLKAIRWRIILQSIGSFSVAEVTPAMMIGFAGNNVLPSHLGELIRTIIFSQRFACPLSGVFTTILVERIFDVIAILVLYEIGIVMISSAPEVLKIGAWFFAALLAGIILAITLMLWKPGFVFDLWVFFGKFLSTSIQEKGRNIINNVITALSALKSPTQVSALIILSFIKWPLIGGILWLSLYAYGLQISLPLAFIVLGVLILATTIPTAPGYIGAIQAAFVFTLTPFGISEEIAFASSVLFLVSQWLPVTVVGACCFINSGLHLFEVRRDIEVIEEET